MSSTYLISPNDWLAILFRLSFALVIGGIIGVERQLKHKPAGLRTHMMVSLGSALFIMIPLALGTAESNQNATSRVIQGIAAGVGFLGAGEILRQSRQEMGLVEVQGLTSASAIWVSAALGIAAGCGFWQLGLIGALLSFFVLTVLKVLERRIYFFKRDGRVKERQFK